jgi:hypothetical protein
MNYHCTTNRLLGKSLRPTDRIRTNRIVEQTHIYPHFFASAFYDIVNEDIQTQNNMQIGSKPKRSTDTNNITEADNRTLVVLSYLIGS